MTACSLRELSHSLSASFCGLGLLLFFLNARFIVEPALLDLGEEPLFGQFLLEIPDGFLYLIVMNNYFHFIVSLCTMIVVTGLIDGDAEQADKPDRPPFKNKKASLLRGEMLFQAEKR